MIKKHELLGYPKYIIYQDDNLYKFNLDSLLIAYFTAIKPTIKQIVDLGAGNGAISLYLTLKTKANITAVEIQEKLYDLLVKSININNLNEFINPLNIDMLNITNYIKPNSVDIVVCNPPYFKVSKDSNLSLNESLNIARHEVKITLKDIIQTSSKILKNKGSFNIVHRPERMVEIIELFKTYNIMPKRICFVYPKVGSNATNILIEGIKDGKDNSLEILEPLYIYNNDGSWSKESLEIFNFKGE